MSPAVSPVRQPPSAAGTCPPPGRRCRPARWCHALLALWLPPCTVGSTGLTTLDAISVSARKRETSLQETPVAITVLDAQPIQELGGDGLGELSIQVPTLHIGETLAGDQLFLRGAGAGLNQGFEQSVGVFLDGLYLGRGRLARAALLDLERIEVLKGPQGPLFGKNTVAGALSLHSAAPGTGSEGRIQINALPQRAGGDLEAMRAGPLGGSGLQARLALRLGESAGYVRNPLAGDDEPASRDLAARLTLAHRGDGHRLTARWFTGRFDTDGRHAQLARCAGPGALLAPPDDCTLNRRRVAAAQSPLFDRERDELTVQIAALHWETDLPWATLNSLSGRVAYDSALLFDADLQAANVIAVDQTEDYEQWSQELRLSSRGAGAWDWLAGLYAERADLDTGYDSALDLRPAGNPAATSRNSDTRQRSLSLALFGELGYQFNPAWHAGVALRYTRERKRVAKTQVISRLFEQSPTGDPLLLGTWAAAGIFPHQLAASRREADLSPEFTLSWQASPTVLGYLRALRGHKTGGFDHAFTAGPERAAAFEFDGETATLYEVGVKTRFPARRLSLDLAVHHTRYHDLQVSTFNGLDFTVGNAARATARGVELDLGWRPDPRWQLDASLAWLDARYDRHPGAACHFGQTPAQGCLAGRQDLAGHPTQFSPRWSAAARLTRHQPLTADLDLSISLNWLFRDRQAIASDADPFLFQGAYSKFNLHLALGGPARPWELALLVRNLTDKRSVNWGNDLPLPVLFGGSYFKLPEPPRTLVLQYRYWF